MNVKSEALKKQLVANFNSIKFDGFKSQVGANFDLT